MQLLFVLGFVVVGAALSLLIVEEKGPLFPLRALGFLLALAVVVMFNVNWLSHISFNSWLLLGIFFLLGLSWLAAYPKGINFDFGKLKKAISFWWRATLLVLIGVVLAWFYFQQDWAAPRYRTPDSGVHFLYGYQTAQSGLLPFFDRSSLYEASGRLPEFESHQQAYLPGAAAVFTFLYYLIKPEMASVVFQLANALGFALVAAYLVMLAWERKIFRRNWLAGLCFALLVYLGTTFNLLLASYSSQLWGLVFLIFFLDSYDAYLRRKESAVVPTIALSALLLTYFYWLPVAILFVFFNLLQRHKEWLRVLLAPACSLALGIGYVVTILSLKLVGYAAADGGFPFQGEILSDTLFVLPFAIWQGARLLRRKDKKDEERFILNVTGAILLYGMLLATLYFFGRFVSHYTAVKVSFAVVPAIWLLALMFFAENWQKVRGWVLAWKTEKKPHWSKVEWKTSGILIVLYFGVFALSLAGENKWRLLTLEKGNFAYAAKEEMPAIITREQLLLLDDVKQKHQDLLQDKRIFVVAPEDTALWSFAYSGIWPRTFSLVPPEGPRKGSFSQMSFYSAWIGDYATWLAQDEKHALVFLNGDESDRWASRNGFVEGDYKKVARRGDNALLVLPAGTTTPYIITKDEDDNGQEEGDKKPAALEGSFMAARENVLGLMVPVEFEKAQKKGLKLGVTVFEGSCTKKGVVVAEADSAIKDMKSARRNAKVIFRFDDYLQNVAGQEFCFEVKSDDSSWENVRVDYQGADVLYGFKR